MTAPCCIYGSAMPEMPGAGDIPETDRARLSEYSAKRSSGSWLYTLRWQTSVFPGRQWGGKCGWDLRVFQYRWGTIFYLAV